MTHGLVVIVGAGIGALTAAIALQRAGAPVTVHEEAPELTEAGAEHLQPGTLRLDRRCLEVREDGRDVRVRFAGGHEVTAALAVSADGLHSRVLTPTAEASR